MLRVIERNRVVARAPDRGERVRPLQATIPYGIRDAARHRIELEAHTSPEAAANLVEAAALFVAPNAAEVTVEDLVDRAYHWIDFSEHTTIKR
jgi:predicted pyridoxine 5'-phosphate oxidase superfamily flavin-nucleotide-binding protein